MGVHLPFFFFFSPSLCLVHFIYTVCNFLNYGRLHVIQICELDTDSGSQENGKVSLPEADKSRPGPTIKVTARQTRLRNIHSVRKLPNYP